MRIRRPFAAIAFAAVVACTSDPLTLCACSQVMPYTVVHGRVSNPWGTPVPGVTVYLEMGPAGCGSPVTRSYGPVEEDGQYSIEVYPVADTPELCVRLAAIPPSGYDLRGSDTLQLALPTPRTFPADSIRRDLALRAP